MFSGVGELIILNNSGQFSWIDILLPPRIILGNVTVFTLSIGFPIKRYTRQQH
jgi:hypothetical protein